jgi:two-component system, OmpR family, phosphate regulon response regulator PhoB
MVADFFAQHGWEVIVASDGEAALGLMRERQPELVCLDLNLPSLSGYDICEMIRSDCILKDTPVLMTSARTSVDVRAFSLECGADAYLAKPYALDQLAAVAETLASSGIARR